MPGPSALLARAVSSPRLLTAFARRRRRRDGACRHVAALYPQLLERLVIVNAPQARLWSRNVYSFPQLLKVSIPSPERCVAGPPNKDADGGPWR